MEFYGGNTQQRIIRNYMGRFQVVQGDEYTGAQLAIEIQHLMVHAGRYFSAADIDTDVDIAGPKEWLFITPDDEEREIHISFAVSSSAQFTAELFEGATASANGTQITPKNHKRYSTYQSQLGVYADPTITDEGELIDVSGLGVTGGSIKLGGVARSNAEWDLKANTAYLLRVTVGANDSVVSQATEWYEFEESELTFEDPNESSSSS